MSGDFISREAAIERATRDLFDGQTADYVAADIKEKLNAVPAADVVERPRWIPVTERLPKNYTDVLIYYERNAWPYGADYPVRKREIGIGFCGWPDRWHVDHCSGVDGLAWMPLPEPPKDEAPAKPYDLLYEEGEPDA